MNQIYYEKYAEVLLYIAVNLQEGDVLIIQASPQNAPFVRVITETAYAAGAKYVWCDYADPEEEDCRCRYSKEEYLEYYPEWLSEYRCRYAGENTCILNLDSPRPGSAQGLDRERLSKIQDTARRENSRFRKARDKNHVTWVKTCIPSGEWAGVVYPELSPEQAYEKLWEDIIHINRLDAEDPVEAWRCHKERLRNRKKLLDSLAFKRLHFKSKGTDLMVRLAENSAWTGGYDVNEARGLEYIPNIPTEELFSVPHKYGVNGTVSSTLPLNYNGTVIEGIRLKAENGLVVESHAETGQEALRAILNTDAGSCRFGEAALVSVDSPICRTGRIFYNTLLDENAVCHLALGKALAGTVPGAGQMTDEEADHAGLNRSSIHVDFMIGSQDMSVRGQMWDGSWIEILAGGKWTGGFA